MKKLYKLSLLTIISIFLSNCKRSWDVTLYAQKIEKSSKILYKYDAWGGRDTNKSGYTVLDSTVLFDVDKIVELPISYFYDIPTRKAINMLETALPNNEGAVSYFPIKIIHLNAEGINVTIKKYQYNAISDVQSGLRDYTFSSFNETRDSLRFFDLNDTKSLIKDHRDSLKFKKTNVVIRQLKSNEIISIDIEDLVTTPKDSLISIKTYFLKPKNKLTSDKFSDHGIFKEKY